MPKVHTLEMKPWQRGYPLAALKQVKKVFDSYDEGHCFGAFSPAKENTIADWLSKKVLSVARDGDEIVAAIVVGKGGRTIEGFCGPIGTPSKVATVINRIAYLPGRLKNLLALVADEQEGRGGELWLQTWAESQRGRAAAAALAVGWVGSKVMASSEIVGVFCHGGRAAQPTSEEQAALCKLGITLNVAAAVKEMGQAGLDFGQHYSTYNKRASWTALALRGFGGKANFIIKPSEMSRKWKEEHPEEMGWVCADTPQRARMPALEKLIGAVPGEKERIRLMRLAPGGGELTRHADITDPDAGVAPGRLMRIHVPLITNPRVLFRQWLLDGSQKERVMGTGEVWYLDTRKPHTAVNDGETGRVHLVMDVHSNDNLLDLLEGT
jgi:hypothetical protein